MRKVVKLACKRCKFYLKATRARANSERASVGLQIYGCGEPRKREYVIWDVVDAVVVGSMTQNLKLAATDTAFRRVTLQLCLTEDRMNTVDTVEMCGQRRGKN